MFWGVEADLLWRRISTRPNSKRRRGRSDLCPAPCRETLVSFEVGQKSVVDTVGTRGRLSLLCEIWVLLSRSRPYDVKTSTPLLLAPNLANPVTVVSSTLHRGGSTWTRDFSDFSARGGVR